MNKQFGHLVDVKQDYKPKKNWAVFLDRDGVIIKETPNLLYNFKDFVFIPQAFKAVKLLNERNIPVFLTTNQTTVARGLCKEDFVVKTHQKIKKGFKKKGAFLDGIFACLHTSKADVKEYRLDCSWRKPNFGMFEFIAKKYNLNLKKSFLIGDSARDILTAQRANIKDILVKTGHAGKGGIYSAKPSVIKENVLEAVKYILKETDNE